MEWADKYFKEVGRLIYRLERVYGRTLSASIQEANHPVVEMPELKGQNKLIHARHVTKKPLGQNQESKIQIGNKYGVRIPHCVKEALQYDNANSNGLWKKAIVKEINALMRHCTF